MSDEMTKVKIDPGFDSVDPPDGYDDARYLAADDAVQRAVAELIAAGGNSAHVAEAVQRAIDEQ